MDNYTHYRTCVGNIHYHIIWCVKYRKPLLNEERAAFLLDVLRSIGEETGFTVETCEVGDTDHVHCFITAPPKLSITFIVKHLKGTSAIRMFRRFPELRDELWNHNLWGASYFVETIGSTSEENIRRYIESQNRKATSHGRKKKNPKTS